MDGGNDSVAHGDPLLFECSLRDRTQRSLSQPQSRWNAPEREAGHQGLAPRAVAQATRSVSSSIWPSRLAGCAARSRVWGTGWRERERGFMHPEFAWMAHLLESALLVAEDRTAATHPLQLVDVEVLPAPCARTRASSTSRN
jgi:hypothetical protein